MQGIADPALGALTEKATWSLSLGGAAPSSTRSNSFYRYFDEGGGAPGQKSFPHTIRSVLCYFLTVPGSLRKYAVFSGSGNVVRGAAKHIYCMVIHTNIAYV